MNNLLKTAISACLKAGEEILKIYKTDFEVEFKSDESPLTLADKNANEIIMSFLSKTEIPVLSEEGREILYEERKHWSKLWIVDPLDGTKEFVKRNDEFTVNIALIKNKIPIMGVVYAPVLDILFYGTEGIGAFKVNNASKKLNIEDIFNDAQMMPLNINKSYYAVVASRSHMNMETTYFIEDLKKEHNNIKIVNIGSSLKICMVAEGLADIYPRFSPTCEWDTAAGHGVVRSAGGRVVQAESIENEVIYNKENILNPSFIVKPM